MGPGFMGPPPHAQNDKLKEPKPKNIKEVPTYLKNVISKTLYRLFYIVLIVWETNPFILFAMVFMAIFNGVMPVINAYISSRLVNSLVSAFNAASVGAPSMFNTVLTLLVTLFGLMFFSGLISSVYNIFINISRELVTNHVNVKIMHKAKEIDLASYDSPEFYEKLENASREAGHRPIQIMDATFRIVSTIISMVSFIVILWAISPIAPLIVILMSVPSAIINFVYRRKNFLYMRFRSKDRRQLSYYSGLMTNKDMVKEIRIFGLSDTLIGRYTDVFKKYFSGLKKLFISEGAWNISISLVTTIINCCMYLFIAKLVCEGAIEVGDYTLYTGALNSIAGGIGTLIATTATIYEGTLFIDNMIVFMNEKKTVAAAIDTPLKPARHCGHQIVFENVSFRYPGTQKDVIKNVNLTFNPGDTVVLVGLNGAGKTTLIKLLTRLYDPTEGRILLDGNDIRNYDVEELYKIYGIIFQDFGKYAVSVRENISFGDIDRDVVESDVENAAVQSNSADFINALPDKYDTPLMRYFEDNGIEPSIGQWQKLSVARAFYSDSDILILDEPTASLDAIAEQEIYSQFDSLRKDKLTIFVSHRLSSATVASKIVVLQNGQVIEEGNHSELMKLHGHYYELFSTQAKRYIQSENEINDPSAASTPSGSNSGMNGMPPHFGDGKHPHHGGRPPFEDRPQFDGQNRPPMNGRPPFGEIKE